MEKAEKSEVSAALERLLATVDKLRGEEGCPWDRAQTYKSLEGAFREELEEVIDGIRYLEERGDPSRLVEEMGDLLFLILLESRIGQEEGLFSFENVVDRVNRKMVFRHPQVFPEAAMNLGLSWEELKAKEKAEWE